MAITNYTEPGVYLSLEQRVQTITLDAPAMIPLFVGTAADYLPSTETLIRNDPESRVDPDGTALENNQDFILGIRGADIISIGFSEGSSIFEFSTSEDVPSDVILTTKNIVNADGELVPYTVFDWTVEGLEKAPDSVRMYVTYKTKFDNEELQLIGSYEEAVSLYGPLIREYDDEENSAKLNNLVTAIWMAFENGAPEVFALPVVPGNTGIVGETLPEAYARQLQGRAFYETAIWRVVPVDLPVDSTSTEFKQINLEIDKHIRKCSAYEEKKERTAIYGYTEYISTIPDSFISNMKAYAATKKSSRIILCYPDKCSMEFPRYGNREGGAQFIAAAYAGGEAANPGWQPKTRMELSGITNLPGVGDMEGYRLSNEQLNDLASGGVMIVVQDTILQTPRVRHQLTTNTDSVYTREDSIWRIQDYVTKYARNVADLYIGRTNITTDTITRLQGSFNTMFASMVENFYLKEYEIIEISEDADNPDRLFISASVVFPYPTNRIDIVLYI